MLMNHLVYTDWIATLVFTILEHTHQVTLFMVTLVFTILEHTHQATLFMATVNVAIIPVSLHWRRID